MVPNLRISWRQIRNRPLSAVIHILGLSIGICACIVIWLIVRYDWSFDGFHPDSERIYRIVGDQMLAQGEENFMNSPSPDAAPLEHALPGIESEAIFHFSLERITVPATAGRPAMAFDGKQPDGFSGTAIFTGPGFFDLFPHRWLVGNPAILNEPGRVVLTENAARKYFGAGPLMDMIGKQVIYADSIKATVGGIVKDWDQSSDLGYTDFVSISTPRDGTIPYTDWRGVRPDHSQVFVRLNQGTTAAQVDSVISAFYHTHKPNSLIGASHFRLYLQPLTAMHFMPDMDRRDDGDSFRKAYLPLLYTLVGIALFILLLAIINFVNLSTAQSLQRVKEVGIRKVMGSSRRRLVGQFLMETFTLVIIAVVISCLLVRPVLTLFSAYIPAGVHYNFWNTGNGLFLVTITVFTTLIAGMYPAWASSAYLPVESLKGSPGAQTHGGERLRKTLIVFQFTISLIFIIGALVIGRQIRYMRTSDQGFDSDQVVTVSGGPGGDVDQMKVFAQTVRQLPGIRAAICEGTSPMGFQHIRGAMVYRGKEVDTIASLIQLGDVAFIPFYKMRLTAGRNFLPGDSVHEVVVNESYVHAMGLPSAADAIGKILYARNTAYAICGVIGDFHEESFHEPIRPLVIRNMPEDQGEVAIRLASKGQQAASVKATLAEVTAIWKRLIPQTPIQYTFLNETIARLYEQERNTAWLIQVAVAISLTISCMGLFGLALFTASRRAREIGIRKVLGATGRGLVFLLIKNFLGPVLLALCIAAPIAWYWGAGWLAGFAYRTSLSGWIIVEAGLASLALAVLTVGVQALKVAQAKPALTLRTE